VAIFGFGKKEQNKNESHAPPPGLPLGQVMSMRQRGMDNNQVISELERQGYSSSQIFDAMNQANIGGANVMDQEMSVPPQQFQPNIQQQMPPQFEAPTPEPAVDKEQIEEMAEAIIDEKWKVFEKDLKVLLHWKGNMESKMAHFDQQLQDLSNSLNNTQKSLLSKVSDYDKNISNVGVEIKAMEKVFQKVLPSLTENVNKLERITKSARSKKEISSS
jgi:hypothetical protein